MSAFGERVPEWRCIICGRRSIEDRFGIIFRHRGLEGWICYNCYDAKAYETLPGEAQARILLEEGMNCKELKLREELLAASVDAYATPDALAALAVLKSDLREVERINDLALGLDPYHITAFHTRLRLYTAQRDWGKALAYLERHRDRIFDWRLKRSLILRDLGKMEEARVEFEEALSRCETEIEREDYNQAWRDNDYWRWKVRCPAMPT